MLLSLLTAACGSNSSAPGPSGLTVRVAPLHDYAWLDRNESGQPDQFKPESEREALYTDLTARPADLLVLRGLGHPETLDHLQEALAGRAAAYEYAVYLPGPDRYHGIGFLSRRPFNETLDLSLQTFRIRDQLHQPFAGAVRFGNLWIWNARAPSPSNDYEQRRNEARLLSQAIRAQLAEGRDVLLSLHSREDPGTPMLRMIEDTGLLEISAADDRADRWTFRDPGHINYRRDQWLFASPGLDRRIDAARVLDTPDLRAAGPFRHQELTLPLSEDPPADGHTPSPADPAPAQTPARPRNTDPALP
ncbi:MAG: endonuclease/exonuclease/phosphatase family protein [Verrucomicrobia bacterium]|nr:endonuclease/exonuclease/phosphatase family protein [Verrucomicrobiota bacterium]MCH8526248.1 hypothetical protein [Kiritimatiellia bacterium]